MTSCAERERYLAMNRAGWNQVAPKFHGATALPEYGPLAPTEDTLKLLEITPALRVLELACGSGHSLRYLAELGVEELWGLDLSRVQIGFAQETLRAYESRVRLVSVEVQEDPADREAAIATVTYRLVATQATERVTLRVTMQG